MFLPHLASLGFVKAGTDVTGFANFPVQKRRNIAQDVVGMYSLESSSSSELTTDNSLRTMLDCMGQALSLPIEDFAIMRSVINLYRMWLLDKNRPPLMSPAHDEDVVKQLSAVFELRHESSAMSLSNIVVTTGNANLSASVNTSANTPGNSADSHAELCVLVLQIFVDACRAGKFISFYDVAVKVMLGITDYVLNDEQGGPNNYLGGRISARTLAAFFEILFTSGTRNEEIWEALPRLAQRWKNRTPLISQWAHIVGTLTSKLIRCLYGPSCGSDSFSVEDGNADTKIIPIAVDENFTIFSWPKIFALLGDFENIPDQHNYLLAVRGIGKVVDLFLHVGGTKGDNMFVDGNSILYIAGQQLFKAISQLREYKFHTGKAEAFQVLMKVFEEKRDSQFSSSFLACFYNGLQRALTENKYLMGIILNSTKSLFQLELPGSHILIPIYHQSVQYVLKYTQKTMEGCSVSLHDLKMSCVRILCYFCSMPSHVYRSQQNLIDLDSNSATAAGHLSTALAAADEFLVLIPQVVLDIVRSLDDPDLQIACLWLGFVFVLETLDLPQCASFPSQYVNLVINRTVSNTSGWEISAIASGLKILAHLAEYQNNPTLCQGDLGSFVVTSLCKLVETHCTAEYRKDYSDEVIVSALDSILAWIMNDTQCLITKDVKTPVWLKIFDALNVAAYSKQIPHETPGPAAPKFVFPSPKVKEAAECAMEQLLCKTGCLGGPSVAFQEADYLEKENLSVKNASCFVAGNTIISLIAHPRNEANSSIKIAAFVRTVAGKFFWESEVQVSAYDSIFAYNNSKVLSQQTTPVSSAPSSTSTKPVDEKAASINNKLKNCFTSTPQQALYAALTEVGQRQEARKLENANQASKSPSHAQIHSNKNMQRNTPTPQQQQHQQQQQQQQHQQTQQSLDLANQAHARFSLQHSQLPQAQQLHKFTTPLTPQPAKPHPPAISIVSNKMASALSLEPLTSPTAPQDLTAVRIFLSSLGLISQPPATTVRPPSPITRHRNISHNTPSSPTSTSSITNPAISTSSVPPPALHPSSSGWNHSHSNFRVIDLPNVNTFDYLFGLLDELRERECYEMSVLYVPPTFSFATPDAIFDIMEGSTKFEDFVQAIGWRVRLADHTGYAGQVGNGLPPESTENSIYYANTSVEVMYRVSTYLARYRKVALSIEESNSPNTSLDMLNNSAGPIVPKVLSQNSILSSPPRFANAPQPRAHFDDSHKDKKDSKRGSFKKSMSVSGGMGFATIPNRDMMSNTSAVRPPVQSVFRKTSFGDEENNINTLVSRKKLLTTPKVLILWAECSRSAAQLAKPNSSNSNGLLQAIGSRALISIIIFPLKSGLYHIRVVKKPSVLLGPLLDDIVVSYQQLPHLVRFTAINACRALNDPDSPKPSLVRKNVIEDFAKPNKEMSFYQFYSPHFTSAK